MGHKINPKGLRIGVNANWKSRWFADKEYSAYALEDLKIRRFLSKKLAGAGLEGVEIERSGGELKMIVRVSKPGIVIGRGGSGVDLLRQALREMTGLGEAQLDLEVQEVKEPLLSAALLADRIARGLERRAHFRRLSNEVVDEAMARGAKGIRVGLSGRIAGAEIARTECVERGSVPLSTLRAEIDFAHDTAHTKYGTIGVKVWVYLGEEGKNDVNKINYSIKNQNLSR